MELKLSETEPPVESPCVSLCCLDEEDVCLGCLRHIDEITGWHAMSNEQRLKLLAELEERRKAAEEPEWP